MLLDFDGTLSPIVAKPELARIREGLATPSPGWSGAMPWSRSSPAARAISSATSSGWTGVRFAALYGLAEEAMPLSRACSTR